MNTHTEPEHVLRRFSAQARASLVARLASEQPMMTNLYGTMRTSEKYTRPTYPECPSPPSVTTFFLAHRCPVLTSTTRSTMEESCSKTRTDSIRKAVALVLAPAAWCCAGALSVLVWQRFQRRRKRQRDGSRDRTGYAALIGNTPLVEIRSLSQATGCKILVKAELLNPGGTSKDRIALRMIEEAEASGRLQPGGTVVEGTSGSTGIALASLCRARGYRCLIVMPDDQAVEKVQLLQRFGAEVEVVKPAGIANPRHYCRIAKARAEEIPGAVYMDQFESLANFNAHFNATAPEIWEQLRSRGERLDAFVMSAGTGGSIAGASRYFKARRPSVQLVLVDPPGSSLYNKVKHGVCFAVQQTERGLRRHRYDTVAEGIGLDRLTANFNMADVDEAVRVSDQEAVHMAHYLLHHEGLFVGSSSAMNLVGAVVTARRLGPGHTVVTVLCDGGYRHMTRFWNKEFITGFGLTWPEAPPPDLSFLAYG